MLTPVLAEILACPRDNLPLNPDASWLFCPNGHRYRVVEGIPIFLLRELEQNPCGRYGELWPWRKVVRRQSPVRATSVAVEIDPFVSEVIGATNGLLYQHLVGKLSGCPIPRLRPALLASQMPADCSSLRSLAKDQWGCSPSWLPGG